MKGTLAVLLVGSLAVGCTGGGEVVHTQHSTRPIPSVVIHILKPRGVTVQQSPSQLAVHSTNKLVAGTFYLDLVKTVGAVACRRRLQSGGDQFEFSEASDAGVTATIMCVADRSKHIVRAIFTPE
jgi:hypothetical protein